MISEYYEGVIAIIKKVQLFQIVGISSIFVSLMFKVSMTNLGISNKLFRHG